MIRESRKVGGSSSSSPGRAIQPGGRGMSSKFMFANRLDESVIDAISGG